MVHSCSTTGEIAYKRPFDSISVFLNQAYRFFTVPPACFLQPEYVHCACLNTFQAIVMARTLRAETLPIPLGLLFSLVHQIELLFPLSHNALLPLSSFNPI